ncbi:HU domain-containing protein [Sphingobacterium pedocola]|uniref:CCDC81-like prokaryotic HU domain-containing protein n=1 Tax=Sphingobacterium pedocola TaxID=2082722 RepID=A0ABR9T4X6_9SPHI|nr:hypothetical protein [Sphingobacterium pedocola]MBE8719707.1 hypothetical protein [Sphingobacterium pedocola]
MNLGKLIHTLLKRQTEVYVKGLGVFKRIHTPATFDAKKNVFLPPITFIEFDSRSTEGYDFVSYLQQMKQNDRVDAEQEIDTVVHTIVEQLNQKGQAKLDDLGYLVSYGDSYVFKAIDLSGFSYESMEDKFYSPAEEEPKPVIEELSHDEIVITNPPVEEPIVQKEEVEDVFPIEAIPTDPEIVHESQRSVNSMWYGLVAIVALSLIGGLYYYSTLNPNENNRSLAVPVEPDTLTSTISVDTNKIAMTQDTLVLSDTSEVEIPIQEAERPVVKHNYQIVIGSHRTLAQAYEQAEAFHKDGYKSVKVVSPNLAHNRKKVVWDTYATKAEMDSALNYVQKHIIADAWPDKIR